MLIFFSSMAALKRERGLQLPSLHDQDLELHFAEVDDRDVAGVTPVV
jgi:hypothetical protein